MSGANHPNRSRRGVRVESPSPEAIKSARAEARMTQSQAADLVYRTLNSWQKCEAGDTKMDPAVFELFRIKTGLDPAPDAVSGDR